jgi:hypothetical protein
MTKHTLNTGTWRRKSGLASWQHVLPMAEGALPTQALCDAAADVWAIIGDFAYVRTAAWTSLSAGEDARVEHGADLDGDRLRSSGSALDDPTRLDLDLDLRCLGLDGSEGIVEGGARLVLDLDWSDPSAPGEGQPQLDVMLHMNADIYAPHTGGDHPDNRALAALNGPRLTAFLRRLRSELGATLVDVDAYAGRGAVDEDGWVAA